MALTITGAKYAVATLSAVGTTTVTCTGTPFTTADFSVPRRVDLYNNALTTFKGCAFVRQATSTSVLELETEFFDPKTGATVTQVAGGSPDKIYVSKNWADIATTGIAVSGNVVTITDTITWGTASDVDSLCFHDEAYFVDNTITTSFARTNDVAGGFITFGHLQSWGTKSVYGGCHFYFATPAAGSNSFVPTSTAARLCVFGGSHRGSGSGPLYFGSGFTGGAYGTDWAHLWCLETGFIGTDILSKSIGSNWTTGTDHVLENCSFVGQATNQVFLRFGNGVISNGTFKVTTNSTQPLAIFGGGAGTYNIGSAGDERAVVLDIGQNSLFWCGISAATNTINYTNVISSNYDSVNSITPPVANANSTKNVYFTNSYSNLQDASGLAVIRDSDWSADDTDTSSGAASTVTVQAFYGTSTGTTAPTYRGPWTYRIRKYGYDEIEGAIAESDYSLGTAGTAKNVLFGGSILQIARASLTGTAATALAYAGITVTDHGASPVTWNSKSWSITIEVDLTTYPTRTAAEVFRHIKAGIASTATFNGKTGLLWHVLVEEDGSNYVTQRGKSGGAGASLKGVRVIDQAGNPLSGFTAMIADDGTTYTPPTLDERGLAFTGLVAGSQVKVFDTGTTTEAFTTSSSGTSETWSEFVSGSRTVDYTVMKAGYLPIRVTGVTVTGAVTGGVVTTPIQQVVDRTYVASSGLTFTTNCTVNTSTKIVTWSVATTGQNLYSFLIEAWIAEASLKNTAFPFSSNGPNSITFGSGWESRGFTTAGTGISNTSLSLLSRDGLRYTDTSGTATAIWAAILTSGVPSGARVRYQQSDAGTTVDAVITSGNMDELVQVYGDASHGNFDRRSWLVLKCQEMGYDQAEFDVVSSFGTLEDQFYVCGLAPTPNGVATGDPSLATAPTISQGTYTYASKTFSVKIVDGSTANTGTGIMRWLRYNFETGGAFQSEDAFNWHDLVRTNGTKFKTVNGVVYGTATTKGVIVYQNDGVTPHPDFDLFTADDGTTATPPQSATVSLTGLTSGSRVQLYDTANSVELYNAVVGATTLNYSETYTVDRTIRLRVSYVSGTSAKNFIEATIGTISTSGYDVSYIVSQTNDTTYNSNGINGPSIYATSGITFTDAATDLVNCNIAGGSVTYPTIYACFVYWNSTSTGIANDFTYVEAPDTANYLFSGMKIRNTSATDLMVTGGYGRDSTSGLSSDIIDTAGSTGNIFLAPDHVVPYATGSGVTSQDKIDIAAQVLTAAAAAPIYADMRKTNGTTLQGDGTEANKFRSSLVA